MTSCRGGLFFYSHLHDQLALGKRYVREIAASAEPAGLEPAREGASPARARFSPTSP